MRSLGRATSSRSQNAPHERVTTSLDEIDDEGYKFSDDNDNGPMLNENNDYILLGLHYIALLLSNIEIITWHLSTFWPLSFGCIYCDFTGSITWKPCTN